MKKELSYPSEDYGPEGRAKQAWDNRLGTAIMSRESYRIGLFAALAVIAVQGVALAYTSSQQQIRTYVREIDPHTGRVTGLVRADGTYTPSQATKGSVIADFVDNTCTKGTDPVMIRKAWSKAYAHASKRGADQLTAFAQENPPDQGIGSDVHQCHIDGVIPQTDDTFQARWTDTKVIGGGKPNLITHWTGVYTLVHFEPPNEEALFANPEGLYVDNFNRTQDR